MQKFRSTNSWLSNASLAIVVSGIIAVAIVATLATAIFCSACTGKNTADTHTTSVNSDHKICYVPLDTRPITYDYPIELASTYGVNVVYPDISVMTWFNETGDPSKIRDWLSQNCDGCDAIVVSAEQLVSGGLIQMRKASTDDGSREATKSLLRTIKREHANTKIYLSNVLMRTSNTVLDESSKVWWEKINEYSALYYKAKTNGDAAASARCEQLKAEIPSNVMETFLGARRNNHQVNMDCVELAHDGVLENLFIYQEDCATQGIQTVEQNEILAKIEQYALADKVMMANGTDEGGSELMMLAARDVDGCDPLDINVVWLGGNADFTAKYEDRPFKQNLAQHMAGMNMRESANAEDVLLVLPPKKEQADGSSATSASGYEAYSSAELSSMAETVAGLQAEGKHCYLLDLDYCNGGNLELVQALAQQVTLSGARKLADEGALTGLGGIAGQNGLSGLDTIAELGALADLGELDEMGALGEASSLAELYGYSGWNTACNSLGTILAQVYATHGNRGESDNSVSNKKLTQERLLDDVVYQSKVRDLVKADLVEQGENVFNISDTEAAQQILEQKFEDCSDVIASIFGDATPDYKVELRWPRTFEIEVTVK